MEKREVRITKKGTSISRWVFLDNLKLCFRESNQRWLPIRYDRGLAICNRIVANNNQDVKLYGNFISESHRIIQTETETELKRLLNGEKIIL